MMILIAGGGIFGVTAALELRRRGHEVILCDPGGLPNPLAESTDLSKVVRCDYGADVVYTTNGEHAIEGWRRWNKKFVAPLYHETGVMFLSRSVMEPGGFEYESYTLLKARGHRIERLDEATIPHLYRAYRPGVFVDGYFHAEGGWAESGAVVAQLAAWARAKGVTIREHCAITQLTDDGVIANGERIHADAVVVCAGSWTQRLLPELASSLRAIGQPVFHFQPRDRMPFDGPHFPVFGADIARTGYYGFPLANGVVKIANHGTGREVPPAERQAFDVTEAERAGVRAFVRDTFPALADAPIVATRCCVYGDSLDGHFWITPHPERPNLIIAAGGSGHAFKFAPLLGGLIANALDGVVVERFRWRPQTQASRGDAARSDH
jgi:sarcosine oxidase / L-pipecolate oxidase